VNLAPPDLSVVVPVYNEEEVLPDLFGRLYPALDALGQLTGDPHIDWDVYAGLEFEYDAVPDPAIWRRRARAPEDLAAALGTGRVIAWVEGRWEIGPRALGHRSLLAEPFAAATRDRLNSIKKRESYRPIAPVCRT